MKLLVIDSNSLLNRAYYGVRYLSASDGTPTNGIYGFLNMLMKMIAEEKPDNIIFAFDRKEPTFRHEMFEGYKATRSGMPDELAVQFPLMKEIIKALGYPIVEIAGFEADDIIGTIATNNALSGGKSVIATGDRDSFQLVRDGVTIRLATTKADVFVDSAYIESTYGVTAKELIDVKGLMGDSSDNIPGVAGIGEKTALSLIGEFKSIEGVYENIESPSIKKGARQKLIDGKEQAFLSRDLARIDINVNIEIDLERKPVNGELVRELLTKLELKKILEKLDLGEVSPKKEEFVSVSFKEIEDYKLLFNASSIYAYTSFDGRELAEMSLYAEIDGEHLIYNCSNVKEAFSCFGDFKGELTTNNLKEMHFYAIKYGYKMPEKLYDIEIAGYVISPVASDYTAEKLASDYNLNPELPKAFLMRDIKLKQQEEIAKTEQEFLLNSIEIPLAEVLASMEYHGIALNTEGLKQYGDKLSEMIENTAKEIYTLAGEEFNINSPKQLGVILFEKIGLPTGKKTKSGYSTNADVLDNLKKKHPIINYILEYRQLSKLNSTYVTGLLNVVDADGRIHTYFRQKETRTGRISSIEPNMQNIPVRTELGRELRKFFIAEKGCSLVDADYSQIELRVLASIAEDKRMIEAFKNGDDIHTITASEVFDVPVESVSSIMRSRAKAVNFGIVYGIGAFSLSQDIGVTVAEADSYIKNYLDTYKGVRQYMEDIKETGEKEGYVKTMYGRRRFVPELQSTNKMTKAAGVRIALNTPIQGTAADIIKLAMIKVYNSLKEEGLSSKLILQVHDELIVEAVEGEIEAVKAILERDMQGVANMAVELLAEAHNGANWLEAK